MKTSIRRYLFTRAGLVGALATATLLGATMGGVALAQSPTPPPTEESVPGEPVDRIAGWKADFRDRLAERLGVTPEELQQAVEDTRDAMLDEAVAEGRITAEQAERIRSRPPGAFLLGPGGHPGRDRARHFLRTEFGDLAGILGLSPEQLREAIESGQSLRQIAEQQGMDPNVIAGAIIESASEHLSQAVSEGRLTQEQADEMLSRLSENTDRILDATPGRHGPGGWKQHHPGAPS